MMSRHARHPTVLAMAIGLMAATHATAAPLATDESPQPATNTPASRATIDPETRSIRAPERGEAQPQSAARSGARTQMPAAAQRMTRQKKWGADGATGFQLDASTLRFTVVRRAADGSIDSQCVQGEQRALQALTHSGAGHD